MQKLRLGGTPYQLVYGLQAFPKRSQYGGAATPWRTWEFLAKQGLRGAEENGRPFASAASAAEAAPVLLALSSRPVTEGAEGAASSWAARSVLLRLASVALPSICPPGLGPLCSTCARTSSRN